MDLQVLDIFCKRGYSTRWDQIFMHRTSSGVEDIEQLLLFLFLLQHNNHCRINACLYQYQVCGFRRLIGYPQQDTQSYIWEYGPFGSCTHDGHIVKLYELTTVPQLNRILNWVGLKLQLWTMLWNPRYWTGLDCIVRYQRASEQWTLDWVESTGIGHLRASRVLVWIRWDTPHRVVESQILDWIGLDLQKLDKICNRGYQDSAQ